MRGSSFLGLSLVLSTTLTACPAGDDPGTSNSDTEAATSSGETSGSSEGGSTSAADSTGDATTGMAPDVDGEEFYGQICAPCHGAQGEGTALGYEIQHPVRDFSEFVVRHGRPGLEFDGSSMAAYGTNVVSDNTLEEVWDYLDSFPQPTTGETLFLDYCGNCHGADALGGYTGVNIRGELAELADKVREGENPNGPFDPRGSYMPAFDTTWLTDAEVQLIYDFVAGL